MYTTLKDIIELLKSLDQSKTVTYGFGVADSYRGSYCEIAFHPEKNAKVSDMLACAESAIESTYSGYKGGDYTMDEDTECNIAEYGCSGDYINGTIMNYWKLEAEG